MNYKDKFYTRYITSHTKSLYGETSLEEIEKQFPIWNGYFGKFLPKNKNIKILDLGCGNGRSYLIKAFKTSPLNTKYLLAIFISFFGQGVYNKAVECYRKIRNNMNYIVKK